MGCLYKLKLEGNSRHVFGIEVPFGVQIVDFFLEHVCCPIIILTMSSQLATIRNYCFKTISGVYKAHLRDPIQYCILSQ